jgi:hypothetical protein
MRAAMWCLLVVVAASEAVLSFASPARPGRDDRLPAAADTAVPGTVDVGAAAACLTWLGAQSAATRVGRSLTWTLLLASVGMNAVVHVLTEYQQAPGWSVRVGPTVVLIGGEMTADDGTQVD